MRENRTCGSEGGESEGSSLPLSSIVFVIYVYQKRAPGLSSGLAASK